MKVAIDYMVAATKNTVPMTQAEMTMSAWGVCHHAKIHFTRPARGALSLGYHCAIRIGTAREWGVSTTTIRYGQTLYASLHR